ncbi:hypothetical protein GYMLUDRAFT_143585, partial [Collybiopsis luxurians FD-317 M1]
EDIRMAQRFINELRAITLDESGLSKETRVALLHPAECSIEFGDSDEDKDEFLALELFLVLISGSEAQYAGSKIALERRYGTKLMSHSQVKQRIASLSGIHPIVHDMCPNSCMAYTGPFKDLESCVRCAKPRVDSISEKAYQEFSTIPIGPYVQALYCDKKTAKLMGYFGER